MMSSTAPTHWTCQCGVQVPMGCSHSCGPFPLREGVGERYEYPRMDYLVASLQAQRDALAAELGAEKANAANLARMLVEVSDEQARSREALELTLRYVPAFVANAARQALQEQSGE